MSQIGPFLANWTEQGVNLRPAQGGHFYSGTAIGSKLLRPPPGCMQNPKDEHAIPLDLIRHDVWKVRNYELACVFDSSRSPSSWMVG